jgi:hypothetical protein
MMLRLFCFKAVSQVRHFNKAYHVSQHLPKLPSSCTAGLKLVLFVSFLVFPFPALWADTHIANSCSLPDVQAAYNAAGAGDHIAIPAGHCTWSSYLTIDKAITIQGSGSSSTTIITAGTSKLIYINLSSDVPVRITGLYFSQDLGTTPVSGYETAIYINGRMNNSFALTQIRIDHNTFKGGTSVIWANGWIESLIDSNTFIDADRAILIEGDESYAWARTIAAGTSHALFIENNTFTADNSVNWILNQPIYHQGGGRSVTRYNTFDYSAYTNGDATFFDSHGNSNYYTGGADIRGQPILEIYNNTFHANHTYQFIGIRGGSSLIYNNTLIYDANVGYAIWFTEEEAWQTVLFHPLRAAWPAQDQIFNTFVWNNTLNGSTITEIHLSVPNASCAASSTPYACCTGNGTGTCDDYFIEANRDYFMHAPAASGGYTYYTGIRNGGSTIAPTTGDTGNTAFSASGPNAYYPYTSYTYPHPLRGVQAPQNLQIIK